MGRKVNNEFYVLFTTWLKLLFALSKQQLLFQYISAEFYPSRSGPYSSPCNLHRWNDGQGKHGWPADRLDFWPSASDSMAILCMLLTINRILFHGLYPGHLFYAVFWLLIFQIAFFFLLTKKKKKKNHTVSDRTGIRIQDHPCQSLWHFSVIIPLKLCFKSSTEP